MCKARLTWGRGAHCGLGLGRGQGGELQGKLGVLQAAAILAVERVDALLYVAAPRQVAVHIRRRHVHKAAHVLDLQRQLAHLLCCLRAPPHQPSEKSRVQSCEVFILLLLDIHWGQMDAMTECRCGSLKHAACHSVAMTNRSTLGSSIFSMSIVALESRNINMPLNTSAYADTCQQSNS